MKTQAATIDGRKFIIRKCKHSDIHFWLPDGGDYAGWWVFEELTTGEGDDIVGFGDTMTAALDDAERVTGCSFAVVR